MKYLIVTTLKCDIEMPVIFPELMGHNDVAKSFPKVVSAGFCTRDEEGNWSAYGESVSLGIKSRGNKVDSAILNQFAGSND